MKKLIPLVAMAWLAAQVCVHAQVTNFNNFRPVRFTVERRDTPDVIGDQGLFLSFSSDIGRVYRLESSTTLTNWALVEELIGSDTNMLFWIPITNMTVKGAGSTKKGSVNSIKGVEKGVGQ
jgi:hypothetical protein